MSSVEVDDTDPRFDYMDNAWTSGGQSKEFDSTSHSSSTAGAQVTFGPFTGTSITVFSTVGTEQTKLHFEVDGGDQNLDLPAEVNPSIQFQKKVYSAISLDPTAQHTLAINLLDAGPFTLDYVLIGGQSNTAILQSFSAPASPIVSRTLISGTTTIPTPPPTTTQGGVGSSITSASISDTISSFRAPSASTTTSSSLFSSTAPMSSTPLPTGAGASMPLSGQSNTQPTSSDVSIASESATPLGTTSTGRPDAIVIGSVTATIVCFAIIVVSMVLCLRRRRRVAYQGRSVQDGELSTRRDSRLKQRPALQLNIPSSLSLPRGLQRPSLLPVHSTRSDVTTTTKRPAAFGVSHTTPSFLAEDPDDSPVFDIKQRPVSGTTMTTRVTVGTTIGQRVSVPESVYPYSYPYPESPAPMPIPVPPLPALPFQAFNPSPTETGVSSATGSPSRTSFGFLDINQAGTLHTTAFSGYSENGTGSAGSGPSASRPLPHIPADTKHGGQVLANRETGQYAPRKQDHPHTPNHLPTTPSAEDIVIHQDGGLCLESNLQTRSRRELPPPYQDFGV